MSESGNDLSDARTLLSNY